MADYNRSPDFTTQHHETGSARGLLIAAGVIVLIILALTVFGGAEVDVTTTPNGAQSLPEATAPATTPSN